MPFHNSVQLFAGLVLDEKVQMLVFAVSFQAHRGIFKPEIRHFVDFLLDLAQNIAVKIVVILVFFCDGGVFSFFRRGRELHF